MLDLLWQRSERKRKALRELLRRISTTVSENFDSGSYLEVFFVPAAWKEQIPEPPPSFDDFATLMTDSSLETGGLPLENCFTFSDGFIARQVRGNNPRAQLLTWRYYLDGVSHITVPFSTFPLDAKDSPLSQYDHFATFEAKCSEVGYTNVTVIDLNYLFAVLGAVVRRHDALGNLAGALFPYRVKLRFRGAKSRVPFLDLPNFISFITAFGIPIGHFDDIFWPSEEDTMYNFGEPAEDRERWTHDRTAKLFFRAFDAFGVPAEHIAKGDNWSQALDGLKDRATKVYGLRRATPRQS
ncbi:hypothetical protein HU230_0008010 [Bradyrhizobium quebecense]|nr:hypothetical protein [Bradyrhizobium quebecense]UGA45971.1 hypothetical protein HU230_0008010 [Bradyrhizobium quebecense]